MTARGIQPAAYPVHDVSCPGEVPLSWSSLGGSPVLVRTGVPSPFGRGPEARGNPPPGGQTNKLETLPSLVLRTRAVKTILRISVFLVGVRVFLFWPSGDIGCGFESQGGSPHLHAFSPVHNGFLRFTYRVAPANLFAAIIAADSLYSLTFSSIDVG